MFQNKLAPIYKWVHKSFDISCSGTENIDPDKNYVFMMNHQSIMDIPIAYSLLVPNTNKKINLYLSNRFYNFFWPLTKPLEVISIDMDKDSPKSKKHNKAQMILGLQKLSEGNNALIYPEGIITGGKTSEVIRGETGGVRLAIQGKTTIIPIGISGSNKAYPFLLETKNPFVIKKENQINVTIGEEISLEEYYGLDLTTFSEENKRILRQITDSLMIKLAELSGLKYNFNLN